ncbi:MAG TPA: TfoX/Sxy family protein [Polyangiaceae bacterium]|nr:TfoX/Sxy family protein [Polyangiaceae bacterium]
MAAAKTPLEHRPVFLDALPKDSRIETLSMFGGVAAKVNGNMFAGVFGQSAVIWLPEAERAKALAEGGASPFDPMGDGRRSDKIMLPPALMKKPAELRKWLSRAFKAALELPTKTTAKAAKKTQPRKKSAAKRS